MHCSSMLSQIPSLTEQRGSSTQCAATLILFTPRGISCQKICFSPKCTTLPALVCWVAFIGRVVERGQNYSKFSVKTTVAKQGGSEAAPPFESDFPKASASSCVHLPPLPQSLAGAFFRLFVLYSFIIFLVFDYSLWITSAVRLEMIAHCPTAISAPIPNSLLLPVGKFSFTAVALGAGRAQQKWRRDVVRGLWITRVQKCFFFLFWTLSLLHFRA